MQKTNRRIGQIRQLPPCPSPSPSSTLPRQLQQLSINNVNLYNEMTTLTVSSEHIYEKYDSIIRDLEGLVAELEERNGVINQERLRLLSQNCKLRREIQGYRESYLIPESRVKRLCLFDVVPEEDSIPAVFPRLRNRVNQILQQSQFDLNLNSHHFTGQISAQLSLTSPSPSPSPSSQQRTPHLNSHHTLIQITSNNNQAPLRIFYLLLLQQQCYIKKLKQLLNICVQEDDRALLHLLANGNQLWGKILEQFLDSVVKGEFEGERELVRYLGENPLIDMLMISLLKQRLPVENDNEDLNIGDWKNEYIDHRALFQGLCNEFDLKFEQDRENGQLRFYLNTQEDLHSLSQSKSSQLSEQNLLESRTQTQKRQQIAQISLCCRDNNNFKNSNSESRQEPIFKIWVDRDRLHYRANISIRPERYQQTQEDYGETRSFHQTQNQNENENENENQDGNQQQEQDEGSDPSQTGRSHHLKPRDLNRQWSTRPKYQTLREQYLKPRQESNPISGNNSNVCSMYECE